jgi:hypothetical protein
MFFQISLLSGFFLLIGLASSYFLVKNIKSWPAPGIAFTLVAAILTRALVGYLSTGAPENDYAYYETLARDIISGAAWLNSNKPTGTSLLHAPFLSFLEAPRFSISFVNIMLSSLEIWLWYKMASALASEKMAKWVAFLLAIYPERVLFSPLMCSEIPFSLLTSAFAYSLFKSRSFLSGFFCGIAQYVRPTAILFLPFLLAQDLFDRKWKQVTLGMFFFLLLLAPIVHFNKTELGLWSASPSQLSGISALMGSSEKELGTYSDSLTQTWHRQTLLKCQASFDDDVLCADQVAWGLAKRNWQKRSFAESMSFVLKKMVHLWFLVPEPHSEWKTGDYYFKIGKVFKKAIYMLAVFGIFIVFINGRPNRSMLFFLYLLLVTTAVHALLEVSGRYVYMVQPFLIFMAVIGLSFFKKNRLVHSKSLF